MDAIVAVFFMRHAKRHKKEMSNENVSQLTARVLCEIRAEAKETFVYRACNTSHHN